MSEVTNAPVVAEKSGVSGASEPARVASPIVGIDLGTTNSLVAVCDADGPRVLTGEDGEALLPSVVRYPGEGEPIVGSAARDRALDHPMQTIRSVKRLMGRSFEEIDAEQRNEAFPIVAGVRGMACVAPQGHVITPQEVSAQILAALRRRAEVALGVEVGSAVITVPAYFDDAQRQATRDAGRLAGLDVVRIVNEPTAAALAYGIGVRGSSPQTVAVYDLGGGTFDVSILRVVPGAIGAGGEAEDTGARRTPAASTASGPPGASESPGPSVAAPRAGGADFFQVLSTAGDTRLGGDDFDRVLADELLRRAIERGVLPAPTSVDRHALRIAAERAKIALSSDESVDVELPRAHDGAALPLGRVERSDFERLIEPLVGRTIERCARAVRDAGLEVGEVDRVVMVGGSSRVPLVRARVAAFFGREPYVALDPDQVVALGAAVQAAILDGTRSDLLLLDVIPLSLGIETVGGAVAKLLMRNSSVPARAREMFSTSVDGQTSVRIHVLQGERELVRDCRSLAEFHLRDIPPMPAGIPQIEVEFLVDANGILGVTAFERRSGRRTAIQVVPAHGLSGDEVERMERESVLHARTDMHVHRVIDLVVNASLDVKWIRDAIDRVRGQLDPAYGLELERRIADVERFIAAGRRDATTVDADAFHRAKQTMDEASVRVHELAIARTLRGSDA